MPGYIKTLELVQGQLDQEESVRAWVFGTFETQIMGQNTIRKGIFVATEKRIVFYAKTFFGFELESFPYKGVSSIEMSSGMMGHAITVIASGNKARMKWINNGDVAAFSSYVNAKLNSGTTNKADQPSSSEGLDIPDQIRKLASLRDDGILTDDEFTAQKTALLAKM